LLESGLLVSPARDDAPYSGFIPIVILIIVIITPETGIIPVLLITRFSLEVVIRGKVLFLTDGLELVEQGLIRAVSPFFLRTGLFRAQIEKLYFAAKPLGSFFL